MINSQLIDYIKDQINKGTPIESISNNLISTGWSNQDIAEALASVGGVYHTPPKMHQYLFYLILFILGVVNAFISRYFITSIVSGFPSGILGLQGLIVFQGPALLFFMFIEPIIAGLVSFFILSKLLKREKRLYQYVFISIFFLIIPFAISYLSFLSFKNEQLIEEKQFQENNPPLATETKVFDFSKDVLFHQVAEANSVEDLHIKDNLVTWVQYTKTNPPFSEDVTNLFLFNIDSVNSKGTISQVTNYEHQATRYSHSSGDDNISTTLIMNGNVYWATPIENLPLRDLYMYDPISKETELVLKDVLDVGGIFNNDSIVIIRRRDIEVPDNDMDENSRIYRTTQEVLHYNILTRQETLSPPCSSGDCMAEATSKTTYRSRPAKQVGKNVYYLTSLSSGKYQLIQSNPWTGEDKVVANLENLVGFWDKYGLSASSWDVDGQYAGLWDTDGEYVVYRNANGLNLKKLDK